MNYPRVSIQIVTWNSMEFLPDLLISIMRQSYSDFNVLIIDNGSNDGVEEFVRGNYPKVTFLRNPRNLGFASAHNQGIRYALEHWPQDALRDRFVLVTNPDIIFADTFFEELMRQVAVHPEAGSFGGKLLRAFGENLGDEVLKETIRSDRFDSTGLKPHRNQTVSDRGAGELDEGQYDEKEQVFGISGALVLYRAQAIKSASIGTEFFDNDFFAYKEDVDAAWRLQELGWDSMYLPEAVAYHYRGMYGPEQTGFFERIVNRRSKSSLRNFYSTRNHWLMLLKNLRLTSFFVHGLWVVPHEIVRFIYVVIFESHGRKAVGETIRLFPKMIKKRKELKTSRVRTAKEVRAWFV